MSDPKFPKAQTATAEAILQHEKNANPADGVNSEERNKARELMAAGFRAQYLIDNQEEMAPYIALGMASKEVKEQMPKGIEDTKPFDVLKAMREDFALQRHDRNSENWKVASTFAEVALRASGELGKQQREDEAFLRELYKADPHVAGEVMHLFKDRPDLAGVLDMHIDYYKTYDNGAFKTKHGGLEDTTINAQNQALKEIQKVIGDISTDGTPKEISNGSIVHPKETKQSPENKIKTR